MLEKEKEWQTQRLKSDSEKIKVSMTLDAGWYAFVACASDYSDVDITVRESNVERAKDSGTHWFAYAEHIVLTRRRVDVVVWVDHTYTSKPKAYIAVFKFIQTQGR